VIIGKIQVKRKHSRRGPVVSRKELVILTALVLVWVGCVLYGVFFGNPTEDAADPMNPDGIMANPGGEGDPGMLDPGMAANPGEGIQVAEPLEGDMAADAETDADAGEPLDVNNAGEEDSAAGESEEPEDTAADEAVPEAEADVVVGGAEGAASVSVRRVG
jgi:hypothetical protein